jgi:heme-degrading monooxygenase HmoA
MMIIVFRSRLAAEAGADYAETADAMLAKTRSMPGFVEFKQFQADDGERLSLIRWESAETLRAWAEDPEHAAAQRRGRERWYSAYTIDVAEIVRSSRFARGT